MMGALDIFPGMPPARASLIAARLLRLHSPGEIAQAVEIMLDVLDLLEPTEDEPDFRPRSDGQPGDPGDHETGGDEEGGAYIEWTSMRAPQKRGPSRISGQEDDEADGAEDDWIDHAGHGPGCPIADPDVAADDVRCDGDTDSECEQMHGDVPMLPVWSAEYDVITDERVPLGISNLQSSYKSDRVRSADSGKLHRALGFEAIKPGSPV